MSTHRDPSSTSSAAAAAAIAYCRIHPGLGIARVGNSPDGYYCGPESPGEVVDPPGGYKDADGRIKRQAARFRIYAYDANDQPIRELTAVEASITWTVHLANRKAVNNMFLGRFWQSQYPDFYEKNPHAPPLRNQQIPGGSPERERLVIDPGPRSISGTDPGVRVRFDGGSIGPLPYTVLMPAQGGADPDWVRGSRDGYMNIKASDVPLNQSPPLKTQYWTPGEVIKPVAQSPKLEVPLGELRTDSDGRLLVLGGAGKSGSLIPNNPIGLLNVGSSYANNDYWYDDISDGPVSATVVLHDGSSVTVKDQAWVLCAVPKFVPAAETLTTLYDIAREAVGDAAESDAVSFMRDVYPILKRLDTFTWLNKTANRGHGSDTAQGSFMGASNPVFLALASKSKEEPFRDARAHVFGRLRPPNLVAANADAKDTPETLRYANASFMPQMSGDGGEATVLADASPLAPLPGSGVYVTWLTLSPVQYAKMKRWAEGDFIADWDGEPGAAPPLSSLPVAQQPAALDRAALEPCVGGAFYPGIEMTYFSREASTWAGLCRINPATAPGGLTMHMALPWQADFSECNTNWWPAQRPDDVVPVGTLDASVQSDDRIDQQPLSSVLAKRVPWARGLPPASPGLDNAMVDLWKDLGFVVRKQINGQTVLIETERSPYMGANMRDYFYYLMNIASYGDFLPRAHSLVGEFLEQAWQNQEQADPDEVWKFFPFTKDSFDARLELIYDNFVRDASLSSARQQYLVEQSGSAHQSYLSNSRASVIRSIFQMAPFNQLDGAWLRGITPDGPIGSIDSMMFSIRMDEMGDGNVEQNHANVYTDLLKSLNIYLPDLHTREYADNPDLFPSAFTQPVFLLAISQFGDEFMPELLGMTLYLEWSAIGLLSSVDQMKALGINPLYYALHLGIDNASAGHGAIAKACVEMYLDQVRESEGEAAMQQVWKRIWTGYVAFGTLGTLGDDLASASSSPPTPEDRMVAMIQAKAPYASRAHREKMLGPNLINDWMLDPLGLLHEMQKAGLIVPGDLAHSTILELIGFNGPMYHVFSAAEQKLWQDYILYLGQKPPVHTDIAQRMHLTIDFMRERQMGVSGHRVQLEGPDPRCADPAARDAPLVSMAIQDWFALQDNDALMRALACERNGWVQRFDPLNSPLVTSMLAGNGAMATAFQAIPANTDGASYKSIIVQWIGMGCPVGKMVRGRHLAAKAPLPVVPHTGMVSTNYLSKGKDGRPHHIWGMGTPH
ncbi:LodA/GoxA family CTQ-dependent oxidase [Massilia sp. P8910]|uniref:LodA/GoxA family CTQ-dependent oxidase n=1 Tax=Massilia antarctica TaxID=2765360 RepID=UPI001E3E003F|nr:LodA/GoxA family CTQ-dependent oxidase [Massilia antarctica]